jgi:hypothetical protein
VVGGPVGQPAADELDQAVVGADQGPGDYPGAQVVRPGPGVCGDELGQRCGVAGQDLAFPVQQRRAGRDHPAVRHQAAGRVLVPGREQAADPQHEPAERRHDRLPGRPVAHGGEQFGLERLHALEDEILLGREVVEHGGLGHLGRAGHRGDRDRVEAALGEQPGGRLRDQLPGAQLLALPQPGLGIHGADLTRNILTHKK